MIRTGTQMAEPSYNHSLPTLGSCLIATVALLAFIFPFTPRVRAAEGGYVGFKTCASCHEEIAADWQKSRHAKAFDSLRKNGQQNLPKCVACHVTGYERPGGFIDDELTPELSAVQCEACHGEGSKHASGEGKTAIRTKPSVEVCRQCHTPGQDPNFDYKKKVLNVHEAGASPGRTKK